MRTDGVDDVEISRSGMTRIELRKLEETIIKKLKENRKSLKISFIGRVSTGKSSIINSILGIDLLPVSCGQTTIYSIFISGITDNIFQLKEGDGIWKTFESINQVKDYLLKIQNENISKIQINLPINKYKILEKCTLIDNPAIGYSDELDKYVLKQCYRSCYLYVLVIDAVASISNMEKKILSALQKKRQISEIKVLLNYSDCIKDEELEIALNHHEKSLKTEICKSEKLFVFSGYAYTENKMADIDNFQSSVNSRKDYVMMKEKLFRGETFVVNDKIIDFLRSEPQEEEIKRFVDKLSEKFEFRIERFVKCYVTGERFLDEDENSSGVFRILNGLCKPSSEEKNVDQKNYKIVKGKDSEFFLNTITSKIQQINKDLSKTSIDILKNRLFQDLWNNLKNIWTKDCVEWDLRCILFFTDILLMAINKPLTFNCNSTKEFAFKILNYTNSENPEHQELNDTYTNLLRKMKSRRFGRIFFRKQKNIINDIKSVLLIKDKQESNYNRKYLIIFNSLIFIECYRKATKKSLFGACK